MIATVLRHAGREPSFLIGGVVPQLEEGRGLSGGVGRGEILVAEACEYDRSFLNLKPWLAVITNIEAEHLDYFRDEDDLVDAFRRFAGNVRAGGVLVANADDENVRRAVAGVPVRRVTFGEGPGADWWSDPGTWRREAGRTRFAVRFRRRAMGEFRVRPPGRHNVLNALAALAACAELGVDFGLLREGLERYRGARRRYEAMGAACGVQVIDDYAHHPTEVAATLSAAREDFPRQPLWCVFQPHQHSRTRLLMDRFAGAFHRADRVLVPDIYPVRDRREEILAVSSLDLVDRLRRNGVAAEYVGGLHEAAEHLAEEVNSGDVVMTMGAGPVHRVGRWLLRRLREEEWRRNACEVPE